MKKQQTILITGGAGYIGSAVAYHMAQLGYKIIIIDKLNYGQKFDHKWASLIVSDFSDEQVLEDILTKNKIDAVVHCAASIEVGLSVRDPQKFYENNVVKTLKFLNTLIKHNVKKVIFSSTCAVYGIPKYLPLTEEHSKDPISAYGNTKLTIEYILKDYQIAYGLSYVALRYFNASGAIVDQNLGERHEPETHLIPLVIEAVFKNKVFKIFGDDYKTQDGTNIRDYLHIKDIASAHEKALNLLENGVEAVQVNLGTGHGYSVKEVVEAVEFELKSKVNAQYATRRPGDPDILVADPSKAKEILGWSPTHSSLQEIVKDACDFYKNNQ